MLDLIAAIGLGVVFAVEVGVLVGLAPVEWRTKLLAFVAAGAWAAGVVAVAALGAFAPGLLGPVPGPVVAFTLVVVAGLAAWWQSPRGVMASSDAASGVEDRPRLYAADAYEHRGLRHRLMTSDGRGSHHSWVRRPIC